MTDILAQVSDPPMPEIWVKIGKTKLTEEDRNILFSGDWLNDRHIDAAQEMLHQQHPEISGFQSCPMFYTKTYDIQRGKKFVQIIHVNENHWITVSTVGCVPGNVKVYDTMHHKLTLEMKSIIADLMQVHTKSHHIILATVTCIYFMQVKQKFLFVEYVNVQLQKGDPDSDVLAVAIATAICHGKKPEFMNFDQSKSRKHLYKAFEEKLVLLPFPAAKRKASGSQKERLRIYTVIVG